MSFFNLLTCQRGASCQYQASPRSPYSPQPKQVLPIIVYYDVGYYNIDFIKVIM